MTNNGIYECTGRTFSFGTRDVDYIEFIEIFAGVAYPLQELDHFGYRVRIEAGTRSLGSPKGISTRLQRVKVFYRILIVPGRHWLEVKRGDWHQSKALMDILTANRLPTK